MELFFEKKEHYLMELVQLIIDSDTTSIPIKDLAKQLKVDKKTVNSIVVYYDTIQLTESGLSLFIENNTVYGVMTETFLKATLYQMLLRNNILFKLCTEILYGNFTDIKFFAEKYYYGASTVYRRLPLLKEILNQYHISLDVRLGNNCLIGEEKQIRHFYYELFFYAYGLDYTYLSKINFSLYQSIDHSVMVHLSNIPFPIQQKVKIYSYISMVRVRNQLPIMNSIDYFETYDIQLDHTKLSSYFSTLLDFYRLPDNVKNNETEFFCMYISTIDVIGFSAFQTITIESINFDNEFTQLAKDWITAFTLHFNVQLSSQEFFFLLINLYYHFFRTYSLSGSSYLNFYENETNTILTNDYLLYNIVKDFVDNLIKTNASFRKTEANMMAYLYYLYIYLIKEIFLKGTFSIKICLFSSLMHAQKQYIQNELQKQSPFFIDFVESVSDNPDVIISNFYYDFTILHPKQDCLILYIKTFPTYKDYRYVVEQIIEKVIKRRVS